MTYAGLKHVLTDSCLFTPAEVHKIVRTVGKYTLGNAVIACSLVGIELNGDDIDALFHTIKYKRDNYKYLRKLENADTGQMVSVYSDKNGLLTI